MAGLSPVRASLPLRSGSQKGTFKTSRVGFFFAHAGLCRYSPHDCLFHGDNRICGLWPRMDGHGKPVVMAFGKARQMIALRSARFQSTFLAASAAGTKKWQRLGHGSRAQMKSSSGDKGNSSFFVCFHQYAVICTCFIPRISTILY